MQPAVTHAIPTALIDLVMLFVDEDEPSGASVEPACPPLALRCPVGQPVAWLLEAARRHAAVTSAWGGGGFEVAWVRKPPAATPLDQAAGIGEVLAPSDVVEVVCTYPDVIVPSPLTAPRPKAAPAHKQSFAEYMAGKAKGPLAEGKGAMATTGTSPLPRSRAPDLALEVAFVLEGCEGATEVAAALASAPPPPPPAWSLPPPFALRCAGDLPLSWVLSEALRHAKRTAKKRFANASTCESDDDDHGNGSGEEGGREVLFLRLPLSAQPSGAPLDLAEDIGHALVDGQMVEAVCALDNQDTAAAAPALTRAASGAGPNSAESGGSCDAPTRGRPAHAVAPLSTVAARGRQRAGSVPPLAAAVRRPRASSVPSGGVSARAASDRRAEPAVAGASSINSRTMSDGGGAGSGGRGCSGERSGASVDDSSPRLSARARAAAAARRKVRRPHS